jgi:hypothetical protein
LPIAMTLPQSILYDRVPGWRRPPVVVTALRGHQREPIPETDPAVR